MLRLLISGGPGSGCTTIARALGGLLDVPVVDSDAYFHKPSDPPFQEQYTLEERRALLRPVLDPEGSWILSGSVAIWGLHPLEATHGVFLNIPKEERLRRLLARQRAQFGARIESGGDMQKEHDDFIEWAAEYEERTDAGRNLKTDRSFVEAQSREFMEVNAPDSLEAVVSRIGRFLEKR